MPIQELKENLIRYSKFPIAEPLVFGNVQEDSFIGSIIDWSNHTNFIKQSNCWICLLPLTNAESMARGMGPHCSGQGYKYDKDNIPDEVREIAKKKALQKYGDLTKIYPLEQMRIISYDIKNVQIQIGNRVFRIEKRHIVFFEGSLFIRLWRFRQIIRDLKESSDTYQWTENEKLYVIGETFPIKDAFKSAKFQYNPNPQPSWSIPKNFNVNGLNLPIEIKEWIEKNSTYVVPLIKEEIKKNQELIKVLSPPGWTYYEHQIAGIQLIHEREGFLLGDEMGAGKTGCPLGYAFTKKDVRVFAVVPSSIRLNWYKEAETFELNPVFFPKPPAMRKTQRERFSKYEGSDSRCVITGYDMFRKVMHTKKKTIHPITGKTTKTEIILKEDILETLAQEFDVFVFDESHKLKNYRAIQTKVCAGLIKYAKKHGKKFVFMTGTPILNKPAEFYTTLQQLIPNMESWFKFTARYNGAYQGHWGWAMGNPSNLNELHERVKTVSRRVLKEDCLDLPDKIRTSIELSKVKIKYPPTPDDPSKILSWMGQMKHAVARGKVAKTIELIDDNEIAPCLVFTHFIDVNNAITAELKSKGYRVGQIYSGIDMGTRNEYVEQYQAGEIDIIVAGIQSAGVGLTMTTGSTVIFNDMDWTPGNMIQAEDRAHRIGQKNTVNINILLADDIENFDQMLAAKLKDKYAMFKQVLDGEAVPFSQNSIMWEMMAHYTKKFGLTETKDGVVEFPEDFLDKMKDALENLI